MDTLAEVIDLVRTKGQLYGQIKLTAPWGLTLPGGKGICLTVTQGSCFLGVDEHALIPLAVGDFVFLPGPENYSLLSSPDMPLRSIHEVITPGVFRQSRLITYGGGGNPASLIAGCFTFASPKSDLLTKYLPPIIHLKASSTQSNPWFQSTLQFIAEEIGEGRPGSSSIVDRLAEVLFVQAMRTRIDSPCRDEAPSWLRALADPQISASIDSMHAHPERAWTVPELARGVSMSRSAFATRFRELAGETPMDHLTHWRMVRAANMMREDRSLKISAVAGAVGYESESAFGKVFRRVIGVPPGRYRTAVDAPPPPQDS
jgi:AraC-like DNA-binding protein